MRNLLILVFIVIVAGAGFWVYQKAARLKTSEEKSRLNSQPSLYADWRTYNSEQLQLAFKYPPNWSVSIVEEGVLVLLPPTVHFNDDAPVSLDVKGELPYARAVEEIRSDLVNPSEVPVTVSGLSGIEISGTLKEGLDEEGKKFSIFTMLNLNGRLVSVDYTERGENFRDVYRAIADSLQFTDAANSRYFRSD